MKKRFCLLTMCFVILSLGACANGENGENGEEDVSIQVTGITPYQATVDSEAFVGDEASNTISYENAGEAGVTADLANSANNAGFAMGDTYLSIENLIGSPYDDTLTGNAEANILTGGAGDDILTGGAGDDTLNGGDGADTVSYANSGDSVQVDLSSADPTTGGNAAGDLLSNIENLIGSSYDDTLTGNSEDNTLNGMTGDDTYIFSSSGMDTVIDTEGSNNIYFPSSASAIDDASFIQDGTDLFITVVSDSQYLRIQDYYLTPELLHSFNFHYSETNEVFTPTTPNFEMSITLTGSGTITGGANHDILAGSVDVDTINGGRGDDILSGEEGDDTINGGKGDDTINGNIGNDIITGGVGDDTIFGDSGNDTINGNIGNDIITGGVGNDILSGDEGEDTYVFNEGDGTDTINDMAGDTMTVQFDGSGYVASDFISNGVFARDGRNLVITLETKNIVTINDAYNANSLAFTIVIQYGESGSFTSLDALRWSLLSN